MRAEEFIYEVRTRPTGNDSPQAWIDYFLTSDHPNLKGKDPELLKRMALAARNKAVHNPPKPKPTFRAPKPHPNARYWWQEKDESIGEAFTSPYPVTWETGNDSYDALATLDDGTHLTVNFNKEYGDEGVPYWHVEFWRNNSLDVTGEGDAHRIFATVLNAMQEFIQRERPKRIVFTATKDVEDGQNPESRAKLYQSLVKRYARAWGFKSEVENVGPTLMFTLTRGFGIRAEEIEEGWKDWVAGAGLGAMALGGGGAAWDAYQAHKAQDEKPAVVAQHKSDFKKGVEKIAKDAVPKSSVTGSPHEKFLTNAAVAAGITGEELAQFLGQCAHETGNFKHMGEIGGSLDFKKYEPVFKKDKKKKVILDPKTHKPKNFNPLAVKLGNTEIGDGVKYHGRGYIQLTGKWNYERAGKALGLDLVKKPELVEKPEVAAKVAVWFWQNRVQPKVDDFGDTKAATKPINPGLKHLDQRKEKFQTFKTAMR